MMAAKSNYDACGLFFNVSEQLKFDGNITTAIGTCSDVISTECIDAILKQATSAVTASKDSSVAGVCQALEVDFRKNFDTKWDNLHLQGGFC